MGVKGKKKHTRKLNKFVIEKDTIILFTTSGRTIKIDICDYDIVKRYTWSISNHGYAKTDVWNNCICTHIQMHRLLTNAPKGKSVDHINHEKSDNRKSNLRIVDMCQNNWNGVNRKDNKAEFRGVDYQVRDKKWRARIQAHGYREVLGYYDTKEDAINVRKVAETELYGEYAYSGRVEGLVDS